jgi:hypothetical protein
MIRTFSDAFRAAGYELSSPRSQWSAIREDGKAVALTVWTDEIDKTTDPWQIELRGHPKLSVWQGKPGNAIRRKHVRHGLDHCGGQFDLILCKAVDPAKDTRSVEWARPWPERRGVILSGEFVEATGEYRLRLFPAGA